MKTFVWITSGLIILLSFNACTKKEVTAVIENDVQLHSKIVSSYISNQFNRQFNLICVDKLSYKDTLYDFYKRRSFKPLWWNNLVGDSQSWENLKSIFQYSEDHGMDRRFYHLGLLEYHKNRIDSLSSSDSAYLLIAELEIITSNAIIQIYSDISNGRTKPTDVLGSSYQLPLNHYKEEDWESFLIAANPNKILENIHFGDTTYNNLKALLKVYKEEHVKQKKKQIDFTDYPKIDPGDTAEILIQVVRKLKSALEPDSSILEVEESAIYGQKLKECIVKLQEKYNLLGDGILGYKTYKLINTTSLERINQIVANMERQRWFTKPSSDEAPFVYVNLPEYMVHLQWPDSAKSIRVCIGKSLPDNYDKMLQEYTDSGWTHKLPKNMETPQIYAKVSVVVLNPTWTVPRSIVEREMYWSIRRDPEYLKKHHYKVYYGKSLINPDTVKWSRYKPKKVPFKFVQDPGEENSLGMVKYIFWNKFDIFMHDTPLKKKFEQAQRAVSHGCVRLADPLLFGEFVMQNINDYNSDDFRIMMGYEPLDEERLEEYDIEDSTALIQRIDTTMEIRVNKPIKLYMDYRTVWFDYAGKPYYCYDIYDKNKYILRRMDEL